MNKQPWYTSWPAIILAFLFFWPVGIVLLVLRTKGSSLNRQAVFEGASNKKIYVAIGVVLIIFGLAGFRSNALTGLFFLAGGAALIYYASRIAKKADRNRQYIDMIVNQNVRSIDKIASVCNVQYEVAEKELNQLISLGVLKGASVDGASHMIRMAETQPAINSYSDGGISPETGSPTASVQGDGGMVTVTCPGCGARILLRKGTHINCEYCDAPLSAD